MKPPVSLGFLILTSYARLVLGQDKKATIATNDTTLGGERVGWVSPKGSRRSTWDIIWSCMTVFFICSWKCTHLNIPSVVESNAGWHMTRPIPWWPFSKPCKTFCLPLFPEAPLLRKCGRKLGFMVLIAIAPEIVVALAAGECVQAWLDLKDLDNLEDLDSHKLTMSHAFFARMGGFVLRSYVPDRPVDQKEDAAKQKSGDECEAEVTSAGDAEKQTDNKGKPRKYEERILNLKSVALLESKGISFNVDREDIMDRAKADGFTKLFALVQAGWLVVQSIARKATGLQITELELMTMAFTTCALIIYILWWDKPFNAERAIVLDLPGPYARQSEIHAMLADTGGIQIISGANRLGTKNIDFEIVFNMLFAFSDIAFESVSRDNVAEICASSAMYASSAAFSAIHVAAYNWTFPYPVVQMLWRIFCLVALGSALLPVVVILVSFTFDHNDGRGQILITTGLFTLFVMVLINVLSRLALIGLTFYCFSSMPVSVYSDLEWTKFFPHFS